MFCQYICIVNVCVGVNVTRKIRPVRNLALFNYLWERFQFVA